MLKDDFKKIRSRLRMYYPKADVMKDKETFDLWFDRLGKADYDKAERAVDNYVMKDEKKRFAPTVGDLYDYIKCEYEKEKFFKRQIDSYFERAVSCYPNYVAEDPGECKGLFMRIVNVGKTNAEKVERADRLYRLAYDTGINIDCGAKEFISFSDLMKGAQNE